MKLCQRRSDKIVFIESTGGSFIFMLMVSVVFSSRQVQYCLTGSVLKDSEFSECKGGFKFVVISSLSRESPLICSYLVFTLFHFN